MAGTAAGAAKATAARLARRAQQAQPNEQPTNDDGPDVAPSGALVGDVGRALATVATVPLAGQAVDALLPGATEHVARIIAGKTKASPAVRANAALEVLKLAHKPGPGAAQAAPAGMVGALEALARAFGARIPRTVEGVASVEAVKPE